jgi:hypothetical protein
MAARKDNEASEITQTPQEAGGVERTAEPDASKVKGAEVVSKAGARLLERAEVVHNVAVGRVVTDVAPSDSDKDSYPHGTGAKYDDPPVRTSRPDIPIAESLGSGAGEHVPPNPDVYRDDGRIRDIVEG